MTTLHGVHRSGIGVKKNQQAKAPAQTNRLPEAGKNGALRFQKLEYNTGTRWFFIKAILTLGRGTLPFSFRGRLTEKEFCALAGIKATRFAQSGIRPPDFWDSDAPWKGLTMCKWGSHAKVRVKIPADLSSTGAEKWQNALVDSCIAPLVKALQEGGIDMRGSCCGHGKGPGDIHLQDGRMLLILSKEMTREFMARKSKSKSDFSLLAEIEREEQ